jgi:serine/threonine-protein kinase
MRSNDRLRSVLMAQWVLSNTFWLSLAMLWGMTVPAHGAGADPAAPASGWQLATLRTSVPRVENVVTVRDGTIYAIVEREGAASGKIVRIRKGRSDTLVSGLRSARGLELKGDFLFVTERIPEGRVLKIDVRNGTLRELAQLHNPNGIVMLPDGDLAVAEDSVNGRIVRVSLNGATEVITSGLNHPEGLAVAADGTLFLCEAVTGRVISWRDGEMTVLVEDLELPAQIELGPDGALWITEDAQPGQLLRYKDGSVDVIASGLMTPQGMAITGEASLLVAERGRNRILSVSRAGQ